MTRRAVFHDLAKKELNEAARYYEGECAGLGAAFLNEIEQSIEFIMEHPEGAPLVAETVRRKLIRRFPFGLLYSVQPGTLRILAVMNQKRRPSYWTDRR